MHKCCSRCSGIFKDLALKREEKILNGACHRADKVGGGECGGNGESEQEGKGKVEWSGVDISVHNTKSREQEGCGCADQERPLNNDL